MADFNFACPHCQQAITADELWAGHELQCPSCQGMLVAPPAPAPAAGRSLVPQPPSGQAPGLSLGQSKTQSAAHAAQRQVPVRNLTAPPPKKQNPLVKILVGVVVVAALGVGGYYGFGYLQQMQAKSNAKSQAELRNSDGGQVGHIADLNQMLDATEPGGAGLSSLAEPPEPRRARSVQGPDGSTPGQPGTTTNITAVIPPVYTLEVAKAKIPEGKVNGTISGSNFVAEITRVDLAGTSHVLRLVQGQLASPDREVLVYLHLKPGEKLGGQTLTISKDMKGAGVPQVAKRWKINPRYAPSLKSFYTGYAMKLELGQAGDEGVPGKIYVALPDTEQTVVAGLFTAAYTAPDPSMQPTPYAAPGTMPTTTPGPDRSAMDRRYGVRR